MFVQRRRQIFFNMRVKVMKEKNITTILKDKLT